MKTEISTSGTSEAVVIVKAAPQVSARHGETVCCAAIDIYGHWLRLYPVSFRYLDEGKKFGRWDRIKFRWRLPSDDRRFESRRIDQDSLQITGKLRQSDRELFLSNTVVTSLANEKERGRSLALLKADIVDFLIERKDDKEINLQQSRFDALHAQADLFNTKPLIPYAPSPYKFKYKYITDDGEREGTCQDWEIEATFYYHSREYGEDKALSFIKAKFGEEYPRKGMLLAMGTHSLHPDTWLINGIVRLDDIRQLSLF